VARGSVTVLAAGLARGLRTGLVAGAVATASGAGVVVAVSSDPADVGVSGVSWDMVFLSSEYMGPAASGTRRP
jgi:hypothetical protein